MSFFVGRIVQGSPLSKVSISMVPGLTKIFSEGNITDSPHLKTPQPVFHNEDLSALFEKN